MIRKLTFVTSNVAGGEMTNKKSYQEASKGIRGLQTAKSPVLENWLTAIPYMVNIRVPAPGCKIILSARQS
jgi:hypothetical protein